jgi:site-specific DNA recombinase
MTTSTLAATKRKRCAIYTRKSTEEGLEQEFNSLDAQRESAEAFIKSQAQEGWVCLPDHYDDGGYTGGNMDRPALQELLEDIRAKKIDVVVVYKVDRLSRSLLDFARIMEVFEKHDVSFASITQQFNSTHSMGRLTLNILLSFAQFEREIISERTRDKIAAARRKGKWLGGHPILGYDIDPRTKKLTVNEEEAVQVRSIFRLYLRLKGLIPLVEELSRRHWVTKRWQTKTGKQRGGLPWSKNTLHALLTNVLYIGQVHYKDQLFPGEQPAIIEPDLSQAVLQQLRRKEPCAKPSPSQALLQGKLRCAACGTAMTPASTSRKKNRRYAYYVCTTAQRRGWQNCPSKSLPAAPIEEYVLEQVRRLAHDPTSLNANEVDGSEEFENEWEPELSAIWPRFLAKEPLRTRQSWLIIQHLVDVVEFHGNTQELTITVNQHRLLNLEQHAHE